jgi:RHS repeat-associated protein
VYELSNHLGNVLSTISDRRKAVGTSGVVSYYVPEVMSYNEYYVYGSNLGATRAYSSPALKYRYGFNGKENDPESTDAGDGLQDYGFRIYNPSLGRFLSVDPLAPKYPELTPYQFASNTPIQAIDLDGLEAWALPRFLPRIQFPTIRLTLPRAPVMPRSPVLPPAPLLPEAPTIPQAPTFPQAPSMPQSPTAPFDLISGGINWANPPASPDDLSSDWEEVTHPKNNNGENREFRNKDTGEVIRFDKGDPSKGGFQKNDHWHRLNPAWNRKMGNKGRYLDRYGNPCDRNSPESHIEITPINGILPTVIISAEMQAAWEKYNDQMFDYQIEKIHYEAKMMLYRMEMIEYEKKKKIYMEQLLDYMEEMKDYKEDMKEYYQILEEQGILIA